MIPTSAPYIKYAIIRLVLTGWFCSCLGWSCDIREKQDKGKGPHYVSPSIDRRGVFRKGHIQQPVSTKKDAVKSRNRSRYYYQTRGKYRRKK